MTHLLGKLVISLVSQICLIKCHYIFIHCAKNWNFMKFQKIDHLGQFIIIQKIKYIYERIISSIISQYWPVVSRNLALILTFLNSLSCQKWTTFNPFPEVFRMASMGQIQQNPL